MKLLACGCEGWEGEVHICTKRPTFTSAVEKVYQQDAWACQCVDAWTGRRMSKLRRHKAPAECIPEEDVEAFKAAHGLKDDGHARALMMIEQYNPDSL